MLTRTVFRADPVVRSRRPDAGRDLMVAGAHGGAGTSTLAYLLRPSWDMGVISRPHGDFPKVHTGGRPIVLVASNTAFGSARATAAVAAVAAQGVRIAVLAVVSDGLPDPVAAAYRFRLLGPRVGAVVRVPFVPALRAADVPSQARLPQKARRAVAEIRAEAMGMAGRAIPGTCEGAAHVVSGAHRGVRPSGSFAGGR